jgi:hypothetical protein
VRPVSSPSALSAVKCPRSTLRTRWLHSTTHSKTRLNLNLQCKKKRKKAKAQSHSYQAPSGCRLSVVVVVSCFVHMLMWVWEAPALALVTSMSVLVLVTTRGPICVLRCRILSINLRATGPCPWAHSSHTPSGLSPVMSVALALVQNQKRKLGTRGEP